MHIDSDSIMAPDAKQEDDIINKVEHIKLGSDYIHHIKEECDTTSPILQIK